MAATETAPAGDPAPAGPQDAEREVDDAPGPVASQEERHVQPEKWYVASPREGCVPVATALGADTPAEVVALFRRNGETLVPDAHGEELVILRSDPSDPGMALIKGQAACRFALANLPR